MNHLHGSDIKSAARIACQKDLRLLHHGSCQHTTLYISTGKCRKLSCFLRNTKLLYGFRCVHLIGQILPVDSNLFIGNLRPVQSEMLINLHSGDDIISLWILRYKCHSRFDPVPDRGLCHILAVDRKLSHFQDINTKQCLKKLSLSSS